MIRAYTFESAQNGGGQLSPYNSKIDARVRRDLFHGAGDLVIVGNRNGNVTDASSDIVGSIGDTLTVKFSPSVAFTAGGRLFSITDQTVEMWSSRSPIMGDIGTAEFVVDVNLNDPNGEYITIPENGMASYNIGPEHWESDTFSARYMFVVIRNRSGIRMYPGPDFVAQNRAGGTVNIGGFGNAMEGGSGPWRGSITSVDSLYLSQTGDNFTLSGKTGTVVTNGETLSFAKQSVAPYGLFINTGSVMFWSDGWACVGEITANPVSNGSGYNFDIINWKTVAGTKPTSIKNGIVLATFTGSWQYLI